MRNLSSLLVTAMLVIVLAWGNCGQCAPAAVSAHDCCEQTKKDCHQQPAPAKQDCRLGASELGKAITAAPPVDLGPVAMTVAEPVILPVAMTPAPPSASYSPPDVWLLDSALLI